MIKKTLVLIVISIYLLINTATVFALSCDPTKDTCSAGKSCQPDSPGSKTYSWQDDPFCEKFGQIQAPNPIAGFISKDPTGAFGISQFLSNLIALFYSIAAVVLIFMLIWGAFEWLTSGGDKEKIASARSRIIHAIIGIILFAVAFAVIQILGVFTGFKFFVGQH